MLTRCKTKEYKQNVSECEAKYVKENFYTYSDWHDIA